MDKMVLIVEDEMRIRSLVRGYFKKEGLNVLEVSDGGEAPRMLSENIVDLATLGMMMPELDELAVYRDIREISNIPIILLAAKSQEEDKLLSYELGADDYMTKSFNPRILLAKAKALLRGIDTLDGKSILGSSKLTINKLSRGVELDGEELLLSPKEYDLPIYLSSNEGIALSGGRILDNAWGYDCFGDIGTVNTNTKRLREKLLDKASYITIVKGSGHKFKVK